MAAVTQDPFYVVKDEVDKAVSGIISLHAQWQKLLEESPNSDEFASAGAAVAQRIKDVEWDLQDLAETVVVVEKNRHKFRIDDSEVESRRRFLDTTRQTLSRIKRELESPETRGKANANARSLLLKKRDGSHGSKYSRLDEAIAQENSKFIEGQEQAQAQIIREQDADLEELGASVKTLGNMGLAIGDEIQTQGRMIDQLDTTVTQTTTRLDAAKRKIERMIHQGKDKMMTILIVILVLILIGIILAASLIKFK